MPRLLRARAPLGQRRTARVLRGSLDALIAAALAPACAACHRPLDSPLGGCVCPVCWGSIVPVALPQWTSAHITAGASGGRYEGALRDIIHAFKYEGRRSLAAPLTRLMRDAGEPLLQGCDCVVPVPLHPWRRLRRGFNQARDLAQGLDRPVVDALWRVRATPSQTGLHAAARRANLRGAFMASPFAAIDNRIIVLVDDVRTTGATVDECAKVLLRSGAREVRALTVALA